LKDEEFPKYDEKEVRIDHFWRELFDIIEDKLGEKPEALMKFIKIA
jgi:hypothetical protein